MKHFKFFKFFSFFLSFFVTLIGIQKLFLQTKAYANTHGIESSFHSELKLTKKELIEAIEKNIEKVPEFQEIKRIAKELGVRVYLFGGTAASYAHYVKNDLLRLRGDTRFQSEKFGYDYTDIYRSTQDMDLVMDGSEEKAQRMEELLSSKFPYFQGNKSAWEVRLLRKSIGTKEALLHNKDFFNQHTDSHSTGLIELTSKKGEQSIKDLRDWESKNPHFLADVLKGELTYYHSTKHKETERYKQDINPEIFSVIRALTKVFQYDLDIKEEALIKMKGIIDSFSESDLKSNYAKKWIEENGKKLMFHSLDVEKSWDVLEELGLREKLINLGDKTQESSLAWLLDKEPLRSKPLGEGKGETAKELGISIVSHSTSNFKIYEIITRSYKGEPNVFISRRDKVGEAAAFGEGFYTQRGTVGGTGSGFNIRFEVDPRAREGIDFEVINENVLLIKNKRSIKVIPESLNIGFKEYFEILSDKKIDWSQEKGLLEKLRNKIHHQDLNGSVKKEEIESVLKIINKEVNETKEENLSLILRSFFALEISKNYPHLVEKLIQKGDYYTFEDTVEYVLSQPHFKDHPELVKLLIEKGDEDVLRSIAEHVLSKPHYKDHPEFVKRLIEEGTNNTLKNIAEHVLSQPHYKDHPELVKMLIEKGEGEVLQWIAEHVLSKPHYKDYKDHPELVERLIEKGEGYDLEKIAEHILSQPHYKDHPDLVKRLIEKGEGGVLKKIAEHVLSKPHYKDHPELVERLIEKGEGEVLQWIAEHV
ncbi:MAG: hypothetical protein GDA46_07350, partial [Bdellovibrionales bacterium]|nr:hypothetical protein [Bdellovibrionales bacterium]